MVDPVEAALVRARQARAAGDGPGCCAAMRDAHILASGEEEPGKLTRVAWQRAKAEHDFGTAAGIREALTTVVELADPFAGSEAALSAAEALARRMWDEDGYLDALPGRLLERAAASWLDRDDRVRALWIDVQRAWSLACRGEIAPLFTLLARVDRMQPRELRGSASRHARAADAESSLAWIQLDLARAALRGATWSEDAGRVLDALDAIEDAAEAAGLRRLADPLFLEAVVMGHRVAGEPAPADYVAGWARAVSLLPEGAAEVHHALHRAWTTDPAAPRAFRDAAAIARTRRAGPEWEAWAWSGALRAGDDTAAEPLAALVRTRGVRAFAHLVAEA